MKIVNFKKNYFYLIINNKLNYTLFFEKLLVRLELFFENILFIFLFCENKKLFKNYLIDYFNFF